MEAELARLKTGQEQVLKRVNWDEFLKVVERSGFRTAEMITSDNTILYSYVLWLIGRVEHGVNIDQLREIMARWLFVAQLTGRYTNSPESQIQDDLARLEVIEGNDPKAFIGALEELLAAAAPPDWWTVTLPENLFTSSTISPSFVGYIAALNILEAEALLSNLKVRDWINPARREIKGIEKHHLFPKNYLKSKLQISQTRRINQIANYALVEWSDNIDISDSAPSEYWPNYVKSKNFEAARLSAQMAWHALPENWTSMGFDEFLKARRVLMARVIHEGYKRLTDPNYQPDLSPIEAESAPVAPAISLEDLVRLGHLPPGTQLRSREGQTDTVAVVTEDGEIEFNDVRFSTPSAAALADGVENVDGWGYWIASLSTGDASLEEIRTAALSD